jgi:hypothetical protein
VSEDAPASRRNYFHQGDFRVCEPPPLKILGRLSIARHRDGAHRPKQNEKHSLLEKQKKRERDETRKVHYEGSKDCDAWANKKQIVMVPRKERRERPRLVIARGKRMTIESLFLLHNHVSRSFSLFYMLSAETVL